MKKILGLLKKPFGVYKGKVWHLYSDAADAPAINICYVGTEAHKNTVLQAFFPQSAQQAFLGEQYFRGVKPLFPSKKHYDLLIVECELMEQMPDKKRKSWYVPRWIRTYVDVPLTKLSNSYKYNLRVVNKHQLDYWVTTDPEVVKEFYDEMYIPFINKRHEERSLPMQLAALQQAIANGKAELLLVRDDEQKNIAGMVIDYRKPVANLWSVATWHADEAIFAKSAVFACYHFSFQYLLEKGHEKVSLGFSRSFLNDKVLQFKMKFGFKILFPTLKGFAIYPLRYSTELGSFLAQQPFVYSDGEAMHLAAFTSDNHLSVPKLPSAIKKTKDNGLASFQVFHVSNESIELTSSQPLGK